MSTCMLVIATPAAAAPNNVVSSGTPMKPLFGNAATSAPNAASLMRTRSPSATAIVKVTTASWVSA